MPRISSISAYSEYAQPAERVRSSDKILYIAVALWTLVAIWAVLLVRQLPWAPGGDYRDFTFYYRPATQLRHGLNPYAGQFYGDTPTWLLCFEPLTLMSPANAYLAWFVLNILALAAGLTLLLRGSRLQNPEKWIVAALMVMYPPVATNFWFGQSVVMLFCLLALFIHELQRGRDRSAGVVLAAASLLRAYPVGLLGYLVACRKWRAAAYTVAGCVVGAAITDAFVGTSVIATYAGNLLAPNTLNQPIGLLRHPANLSLIWLARFVMVHGFGLAERSLLSSGVALIAELLILAFAFAATWRLKEDSDWRGFSLWIITVSIASPLMWRWFMVCFIIVYVALAKARAGGRVAITAISSYATLAVFGHLEGYPFNQVSDILFTHFASTRVPHYLIESVTVSLVLIYLACYWFVTETRGVPETLSEARAAK